LKFSLTQSRKIKIVFNLGGRTILRGGPTSLQPAGAKSDRLVKNSKSLSILIFA
jgi:hypothetical protein